LARCGYISVEVFREALTGTRAAALRSNPRYEIVIAARQGDTMFSIKLIHGMSAAALVIGLAACQTNPVTGRSQLMIVSEDQAQSSSAQAYATTVSQARAKGRLDHDPALTQRVTRIANRLIAQAVRIRPESARWQWSVHLLDDPGNVNAWCMPGGKIAVYSGLVLKLRTTDDELAQVLAHEISHALLSHGREQMSRALATEVGLTLGSIAAGTDLTGLESIANVAILMPNGRQAETEADRLGIEIAAKAGFDPNAAVSLWNKMLSQGGGQPPQWLSTHPSHETRIADLQRLVPQMMPYYQSARQG
jgi:predicted Zn-dependent protease